MNTILICKCCSQIFELCHAFKGHIPYLYAKLTSEHIMATVTLDGIVAFVISMVALLMSLPMMYHELHHWNVSVLKRVHISSLVT
jgi:hypothetical protein